MKVINNGITAPTGFTATGCACGIKKNGNFDFAMIKSDCVANTAGVYTTNVVKGHSLQLTMKNMENGKAQAIVINSGNANACIGDSGYNDALYIASKTAEVLDCLPEDVIVGSTGVIGHPLKMDAVNKGILTASQSLSSSGSNLAAKAIMTTDTFPKEHAVQFDIDGTTVTIGGIAKGSGMIHPNMATMIGIITTDANISQELLSKALKTCVNRSFNRVSIDGDTSVCDMVVSLANGKANNIRIDSENEYYEIFIQALESVCVYLSKLLVKDGEGATKLIEIKAINADSQDTAYKIVTSIAKSPLVKTAFFGQDANWGRILTAAGYSGASFNPDKIDVYIGDMIFCKDGKAVGFDEEQALEILKESEIKVLIDLKSGNISDIMWTCDFSYDYVKINGSYRT